MPLPILQVVEALHCTQVKGVEPLTLQFIYFMNIYLFYVKHGFFYRHKLDKIFKRQMTDRVRKI